MYILGKGKRMIKGIDCIVSIKGFGRYVMEIEFYYKSNEEFKKMN